jgi:hypothetical protein
MYSIATFIAMVQNPEATRLSSYLSVAATAARQDIPHLVFKLKIEIESDP